MAEVLLLLAHAALLQEPQELSSKERKKIIRELGQGVLPTLAA